MINQVRKNIMHAVTSCDDAKLLEFVYWLLLAEREEKEKSHEGITTNMELINRVTQMEDYQARLVLSFVETLWSE